MTDFDPTPITGAMLLGDAPIIALINVTKYAKRMGITRQAVYYQLKQGICAVPPIVGTKPPRWRVSDVEAYAARMAGDA